jgi:ElaB/YqjD/DUF883 family membrane-anchored ribosome-binding protein
MDSELKSEKEKKQSLELRVERLESEVKKLTETIEVLRQSGRRTAQVANRARVRTQTYGGR